MIELFAEAGTGESISAAGVIAGFVAIALALVELSKYAIGRAFPSPAEREIQQITSQVAKLAGEVHQIAAQIRELHGWHNVDWPGQPGVKIWWTSSTVGATLAEIATSTRRVAELLAALQHHQEAILARLEDDAAGGSRIHR